MTQGRPDWQGSRVASQRSLRQRSSASARGQADAQTRDPDAILLAIAKACSWIDEVTSGCVRSFAENRGA